MIIFGYYNRYMHNLKPMYYTNKTSTTLAIIAIVTAVTLVTAGNIFTASAVVVKKHTAAFNSISSNTKRTTDSLSQFISCIKAVDHEVTLVAADLCW
jgi:cell shape-determining protein MreC